MKRRVCISCKKNRWARSEGKIQTKECLPCRIKLGHTVDEKIPKVKVLHVKKSKPAEPAKKTKKGKGHATCEA